MSTAYDWTTVDGEDPLDLWIGIDKETPRMRTYPSSKLEVGLSLIFKGSVSYDEHNGNVPMFAWDVVVSERTRYVLVLAMDDNGTTQVVLNFSVDQKGEGLHRIPQKQLGPSDGWVFLPDEEEVSFLLFLIEDGCELLDLDNGELDQFDVDDNSELEDQLFLETLFMYYDNEDIDIIPYTLTWAEVELFCARL